MIDRFLEHISKYLTFTEEEKSAVRKLDIFKFYNKNAIILHENQSSSCSYFIISGCIRCYYFVDGDEKTTAFYTEGESLSPACSLNATPSAYYISAVEDTCLVEISIEVKQIMFDKFPKFETLCRMMVEEELLNNQTYLDGFKTSLPEKRYIHLIENRPDLVYRVPLYQIASYLGITPPSLSRLRKRISGQIAHSVNSNEKDFKK